MNNLRRRTSIEAMNEANMATKVCSAVKIGGPHWNGYGMYILQHVVAKRNSKIEFLITFSQEMLGN